MHYNMSWEDRKGNRVRLRWILSCFGGASPVYQSALSIACVEGCVHACIGRALEWHSRGQRFDPAYLHQKETVIQKDGCLFFWWSRERTADLLLYDLSAAPPTASAVGGSIPLISTKKRQSSARMAVSFSSGAGREPLASCCIICQRLRLSPPREVLKPQRFQDFFFSLPPFAALPIPELYQNDKWAARHGITADGTAHHLLKLAR